ncbi:lipopolysaccharide transport periplasmic protein LptA [Hydrogenovibrio sp. 3SP14C1]|uniref:lipopolysaccharide transport periplasmic protein LptA n=1 Tax=Hydrogenovibrio sp. 3SP14C1 TaxID=3038774 RepID=UPI0024169A45|nr:lipopolysaccharide transport periplasmic protein LptA [Hydrogenovibrio sp. 3SP14C1]MDG4812432.1 lipopolysaccharide transport periplasmic protein LptA [Hydrogenovibrio sp. 3SP14C1]
MSHKILTISFLLLLTTINFQVYSAEPKTDPSESLPIEIKADSLLSQDQKGQSIYTGQVIITQGTTIIQGDKVTIFHPNRKVIKALVVGKQATFKRFLPEEQHWVNGRADIITYHAEKRTVLLEGNAYVNQQGKNSISGPEILYNLNDKTLSAKGDKAEKKRITVIFEPEESNTTQKQPESQP